MKPVEKVKCHAVTIKKHTDDMAQLARMDESIAEGVASFFFELFANLIWMLGDSAKGLPPRPDGTPRFRLHTEVRFSEEDRKEDESAPFCCSESTDTLEATL
jgi:hypothetical protein